MAKQVAEVVAVIEAGAGRVWNALTQGTMMPGTRIETDWEVGHPIVFSGEWKGMAFKDYGEIQQMDADYPVTEFWRVLSGDAEGRRDARQITLFDSVGFAIEDFSALRYVFSKLQGTDFFQQIDIVADPDDPRDLFGMLQRAA